MEASATLKMVEDALYNRFFIIDIIAADNYSTVLAMNKHPSKDAQGQVLKTSKEKLHVKIPEPYLLSDPSHCVKVLAKRIFSIIKNGKAQRCGCTKVNALLLNKDWRYMIKK